MVVRNDHFWSLKLRLKSRRGEIGRLHFVNFSKRVVEGSTKSGGQTRASFYAGIK